MRAIALLILSAAAVSAADSITEAPKPLAARDGGIGRFVEDAAFTDSAGKSGKLSEFAKSPYLVVALTNSTCPLSRKYAPTLAKIEKDYSAKGVAFLFVNATKGDRPKHAFASRYAVDAEGVARAVGATKTTEVIVLDSARTVVYRGAVDDQYGLGYSLPAPKHNYLTDTLDALLAGKTPAIAATTAPGCPLDLDPAKPATVTFSNRISRIVQANCQSCHRKDGVGPFALESYDDIVSQKGSLRQVLENGTMPPWYAAAPKAGEHSHFLNDRSLSPADKADFLAWLKGDLAKGSDADAPKPIAWPTEWQIGKPDAVFQMTKAVSVPATGTMPYQNVTIETNLDEDKWVEAYEIKPSAKAAVHHVLVHVIPKAGLGRFLPGRAAVNPNVADEREGYFAAYVPGNDHLVFEPGYARKLPKGATLRFQMHYTPFGEAVDDRTTIAFRFAKEPPKHIVKVGAVMQPGIRIPPGDGNHKEVANLKVPMEISVRGLMPHMHVRGKACRYELISPDGKTTTTLLDIPRYDFNWQLRYQFAEPVTIAKGSTLRFTVWYDNSDKNPANPDPKKLVKWGPQTFDEMHLGYVEYVVDAKSESAEPFKSDEKPMIPKNGIEIPARFKTGLDPYDKNKDGRLDEKEIDAMPEQLRGRVWDYIRKTVN